MRLNKVFIFRQRLLPRDFSLVQLGKVMHNGGWENPRYNRVFTIAIENWPVEYT